MKGDIKLQENEIIEYVKNHLSEKRFNHSVGVMERAGELAKIYKEDVNSARKVGIAHDIAKEFSKQESLKYIKENNIKVDKVELINTNLLHGKIGADIAKKIFGFTGKMCEAIKVHTTGAENMSMLSKILYVADKTELGRKNIEYERNLADKDINKALLYMIDETIKLNIDRNRQIHPDSILARNYLLENI